MENSSANSMRYCLQDENGLFVYGRSIKKCGSEFFYLPTERVDRWYPTLDMVEKALECLNLHNKVGGLGHRFKIISQ